MSLSGEYLATHDGYWQGTKGYDENKAAFRVQLYNLKLTFREYKEKMNNLYKEIQEDGQKLAKHDLGYNLIYWMAKTYYPFGDDLNRFSIIGSANYVFDRHFYDTALASSSGVCNVYGKTNYAKADGAGKSFPFFWDLFTHFKL